MIDVMAHKSCPALENSGLKISPGYSGKDLAWKIIREESRDYRRRKPESESTSDDAPKPKNMKP